MKIKIFVMILLVISGVFAATADQVLIVVNDAWTGDTNSNGITDSIEVGQYYQLKRSVPSTNVCHLTSSGLNTANVSAADYETKIRDPIKAYLVSANLKEKIFYIVMCYGVPYIFDCGVSNGYTTNRGVDSFLTDPFTTRTYSSIGRNNPCRLMTAVRTDNTFNNGGNPYYFVTRLDGPSVDIAKGLVDKAMTANQSLLSQIGLYTSYVDGRYGILAEDGGGYHSANNSILRVADEIANMGWNCIKDQHDERFGNAATGVTVAANAIWYAGWYTSGYEDAFDWKTGAVGFHLYSGSAANIRATSSQSWCAGMLSKGITATAGAVAEPFTQGYIMMDVFFNRFLSLNYKFNFADACYAANAMTTSRSTDWMMMMIGDPLYTPFKIR